MNRTELEVAARLARWLGPWTPEPARPTRVARRSVAVRGGSAPFDAWVYRPMRDPVGSLLVVPGLHYLGPADPRLDRFLAILADAGLLVLCPFLPEFRRLSVGPSLVGDTRAALETLERLPDRPRGPPGLFSISFGSYPAITIAAERPDVRALVLFGGYASFEEAIRFSLEEPPDRPHDPLNRPIIFINLVDHLEDMPADRDRLREAWVEYVRRTWGRPDMKARALYEPLARAMSERLPPDARELFLMGTGVIEGGTERAYRAIERGRTSLAHLDPRPACARVQASVAIVHGRDDDVIPYTHAPMLAESMTSASQVHLFLTGLYAHTGNATLDPRAMVGEARTMIGILSAIVGAALPPAR